jgi:RHS repeat-associated protein
MTTMQNRSGLSSRRPIGEQQGPVGGRDTDKTGGAMRTMRRLGIALAWLLLAAPVLAQDKIEYYHVDAIGSVRAVTDAVGATVVRHDYFPFGEEYLPPAQTSDAKRFTGKEHDTETALDYFGARYYRNTAARFTTVDPVYKLAENLLDPQRWNRYAYALNSPLGYVDRDGRWPTRKLLVHQNSIDRVLPQLSKSDRDILKAAQVEADMHQSNADASQHAMRSLRPNQSVEDARDKANDFVSINLQMARDLEAKGLHESAMRYLGFAMHTLQDATSPAHEGFQVWDESWNSVTSAHGIAHVNAEFYDPIGTARGKSLDQATQRAYDYFTGKAPLPKDFFADKTDKK